MNELISVIVPVYKVEPHLRKCIDSILNQTYRNLEIILVDDGSPDNCGTICDEYAAMDERLKVIHKANGGLSDARNAGLDIMTGKYVAFVDSDDWIEPVMYEKLFDLLRECDADMSFGGVADDVVRDDSAVTVKTSNYGSAPFSENNIEAMRRYFQGSWAAWDKLYKAELFDGIRFPVDEINEDEAIVLQLLHRCRRVCYTNEVFYHYIKRPEGNSITTSSFSTKKLVWQKHCADNLKFVQENYLELVPDAAARYRGSLMWSLTEMALSNEDFSAETAELLTKLKANKALFNDAPFDYPQDKIRMWMLTKLPFGVYKRFIRAKRNL